MLYGEDYDFEEIMSEAVECGAGLAWRLLATLEGGSLLLAASAIVAYTARNKIFKRVQPPCIIQNVLVTNTTNVLGRELKGNLERRGCVVRTVTSDATSEASSGECFDALILIGAQSKTASLDGMTDVINEDIYKNLKLLELLAPLVRSGGRIAWVCAGDDATNGPFSEASAAFDNVLLTSLQHIATIYNCEPVWIGRRNGVQLATNNVIDAIFNVSDSYNSTRFSVSMQCT